MRANSPSEVAEALAEAINAGDTDAARELWSEDAIVVAPDGSQTVGREAIGRILEQLVASETTIRIELHAIHATQDTAVAPRETHLSSAAANRWSYIRAGQMPPGGSVSTTRWACPQSRHNLLMAVSRLLVRC